jgi:hypothetical protein
LLNHARSKSNYKNFYDKFDGYFKIIYDEVFIEKTQTYSDFLMQFSNTNYKLHPFYIKMWGIYQKFSDKTSLNLFSNSSFLTDMDSALSVYNFSYWSFNSIEENLNNLRVSFILREFLNFIGWDHTKQLAKYKIFDKKIGLPNSEDYTSIMLGENLPELIDDFIEIYLKKDSSNKIPSFLCEAKNFLTEFCNFLYNEGIINYMIEPIA